VAPTDGTRIDKADPHGTVRGRMSAITKAGLRRRWAGSLLLPGLGIALMSLVSLASGSVDTAWSTVGQVLLNKLTLGGLGTGVDERLAVVIWEIRLPRVLGALLTGAALASAGACLQGLMRNGLADPGLIGVSAGGAVGAVLAISSLSLLGGFGSLGHLGVPFMAMGGACLTTWLVYRLASIGGRTHLSTLLLAGLAINAMAGAIVGLILYLSDNEALRRFTFWTLGSLHRIDWKDLTLMLPLTAVPLLCVGRFSRALNAFTLGEAEAYHLGFATDRIKRSLILLCAAMVGASVAFCGLIGFVGLVVPHLARLLWGPDFRRLLPASALMGSLLMIIADLLARIANAPSEIPVGILTALVGAPFFMGLILHRKRQLGV
jgi:iron complex transport system permease protein